MPSFSTCSATIVVALAVGTAAYADASTDDSPDAAAVTEPPPVATQVLSAPDSDTFAVDGGAATLACEGRGSVPVILIAGADDPITRWDVLGADLGPNVLACRFGAPTGPDVAPGTPTSEADALSQALDASELPGPYVLVGHSLGGLTVRRFGERHPDHLGAALLLDTTTPLAMLTIHDELNAHGWNPEASQADADAPAPWPDVPLTVFAHDPADEPLGLGPDVEALWTEGQQAYATLTDDARFEQVTGTGHHIDLDATSHVASEIVRLIDEAG